MKNENWTWKIKSEKEIKKEGRSKSEKWKGEKNIKNEKKKWKIKISKIIFSSKDQKKSVMNVKEKVKKIYDNERKMGKPARP